MKSVRLLAFELIYDVIKNNAYSNLSLDSVQNEVKSADKGFLNALTYGVIERKITLDYIINKFLTGKTKPKVKILLYVGAFQLYFMDKVPSNAAINETVELAKQVGCEYYSKLVNAVLHKIDDNRIDIDSITDLSIRYSCPQQLINMWNKQYGEENTFKILNSLNSVPPVFAVPNKLFVDADELCYELLSEGAECEAVGELVKINSAFDIKNSKAFNNGLFHIEDLSSYNCAKALNAEEGETVLDVCSAPGGKAFTVAECMNNDGKVYAFDLHESRVNLIKQGAKRLELSSVVAEVNDASEFNNKLPLADRILCDVPCSGFGIIRRKPEIRYRTLDSVADLPELQYKILSVSSLYLKKGGRIVYSTCTLNKKENEKVVQRFLSDNEGYSLIEEKTVFPEPDGGDGFYYAVMEKNND